MRKKKRKPFTSFFFCKEPMKPSSDRSARGFCTEGGSVSGWVAKEAGAERKGWVGVEVQGREGGGGWERARRWRGADRDVSAASVIWRRLAAVRGTSGVGESEGE